MQKPWCSYYGRLDVKLKKGKMNVGGFIMDQMIKNIIDKNEDELKRRQNKLIEELRKAWVSDVKDIKVKLKSLSDRVTMIESKDKESIKKKKDEK